VAAWCAGIGALGVTAWCIGIGALGVTAWCIGIGALGVTAWCAGNGVLGVTAWCGVRVCAAGRATWATTLVHAAVFQTVEMAGAVAVGLVCPAPGPTPLTGRI
jgi:hypothetical protein